MPTKAGHLQSREFLFYVEDLAIPALPEDIPKPERKAMWTILQWFWDNPHAHFELQPMTSRSLVELGLHFEGPAEANERWAQRLAERAADIQAVLGPQWELEEWTASWRRLHRTFPFEHLTVDLAKEVAAELTRAITLLWPYALVGAPAAKPVTTTSSRPYRDRYRRRAKI